MVRDGCGLDDPRTVTLAVLERYQRHLFLYRKPDGSPLTVGSQFGCLAPLRTWFALLTREHHIASNPASELQLPKLPKRLPRGLLSSEDIAAILHEAAPGTAQGLRDRALVGNALCHRLATDGTGRAGALRHRPETPAGGQRRQDRVVPLGERAAAWVDKYLIEARPQLLAAETDALFVTDYGEPISPAWLADKVKRHMQFAGIERAGATHLFRHACATHMLENGADVRFLQEMLGHSQLSTTEIYTHVAIDKLQAVHAATHPAARLTRSSTPEEEG